MDYAAARREGLPIGSGNVEAVGVDIIPILRPNSVSRAEQLVMLAAALAVAAELMGGELAGVASNVQTSS